MYILVPSVYILNFSPFFNFIALAISLGIDTSIGAKGPLLATRTLTVYIASRVYHDFGVKDMRLAIRLARLAEALATRTNQGNITKDIVDDVVTDFKLTSVDAQLTTVIDVQ